MVGASPASAAPTSSSSSTLQMVSMDLAKTTARRDENHLSFCDSVRLISENLRCLGHERRQAQSVNTLRSRQNGQHSAEDISKCIFALETYFIFIQITVRFVCKGPIDNKPTLVRIMDWRRTGDKPLSEPMMV